MSIPSKSLTYPSAPILTMCTDVTASNRIAPNVLG